MVQLRFANATRVAQAKPPGPKEERLKDDNNNGQLRITNATSGGARKAAWAKIGKKDHFFFSGQIILDALFV